MLLAVDIGNTETVIGLFHLEESLPGENDPRDDINSASDISFRGTGPIPDTLVHHWRISTVPEHTADEYAMSFSNLLRLAGMDIKDVVDGIAVTSSVPNAAASLRAMAAKWLPGVRLVVLEPGFRSGMPILYEDPREVGPDRIANAIGAYNLYGGPCIVADLGTATTLDGISAGGEYLGGAIMPGVSISMDALFAHAAALSQVVLTQPKSVIGRSTAESIRSGVLYGFAGQLDTMCGLFREELGGHATVVATGGLAELVVPYCKAVEHLDPWLTLYGLRLVYRRSMSGHG
ncbi:MAG: type III pantothenate kinase [Actinobacteria bacterium]|nr:type III pantothenate kinase [Actinomycetota bacterium]